MKTKNQIKPTISRRTVGGTNIRDADTLDGAIATIVTSKDWQRGTRNDPQKCAAARALARSLALSWEQVKQHGLAIYKSVAYVPAFDKKGNVETLRYKVNNDLHILWDKGESVKPMMFKLLPMIKSDTLEAKRTDSKKRRADQPGKISKKIRKRKPFEVRGKFYHHHTCISVD